MIKLIKGKNDLKTIYPDIANEWDYELNIDSDPSDYAPKSSKSVWWKCPNDKIRPHSYKTHISTKVAAGVGKGCSYCNGTSVLKGLNDIATTDKETAKLWNHNIDVYVNGVALKPQNVSRGSNLCVFWKCTEGYNHTFKSKIADVVVRKHRCSICMGKTVLQGFNDFATKRPELLPEWDYEKNSEIGLSPNKIVYGTQKKAWWKCPNNDILQHSYFSRIGDKKVGKGCRYCGGKEVLPGLDDLLSQAPDVAADWDYELNSQKPDEVLKGSGETAYWICRNENTTPHSYPLPIISRVQGHKCTYCHGKKVLVGFNDIGTRAPQLLKEWDYEQNDSNGIFPTDYTCGSMQEVSWICQNTTLPKHSYSLSIVDKYQGTGCPYCSGRKVLSGLNDICTTDPWIIKEWDFEKNNKLGLNPEHISRGQNIVAWWKCTNGNKPHSYPQIVKSRIIDDTKCGICHGLRVEKGINDLATTDNYLLKEWDYELNNGLTPEDFTRASNEIVFWKCLKNKKHGSYPAMIARRTLKENGCPICNESHGERRIRTYLEKHHIPFKSQNTFKDRGGLRDDFAILDKNKHVIATIEFNGKQHYEFVHYGGTYDDAYNNYLIQLENDKKKSDYLKEHNIPQLIIPYTQYSQINTLLSDFISNISSYNC